MLDTPDAQAYHSQPKDKDGYRHDITLEEKPRGERLSPD